MRTPLNPAAAALAKRAWESILFPHDHRPGPNQSLATGAALRLLSRNGTADQGWVGGYSTCEAEVEEFRQAEVDFHFIREGFRPSGGGGEHLIYRTEPPNGFIYKATWRGQFGFVPDFDERDALVLRPASPMEYLLRCGLANVVFGDAIRLFAVGPDQSGRDGLPSILTQQPFVVGEPPKPKEIRRVMRAHGFLELPHVDASGSGLHDVWYRPEDQVMVCDAVAGNFVRAGNGQVVAIDLPAALVAVE
jgi:hypothetical protein